MTDEPDALVGLRFEVGGGLGKMSGRILGRVRHLYLIQRAGAEHLELIELDDLRSAKFYVDAESEPPPAASAEPADAAPVQQSRRRLSDHLRRSLTPRDR